MSSASVRSSVRLPAPPPELAALSAQLCTTLVKAIERDGPMPFSSFMRSALYEPGLGYYVNGLHKFGEAGDFITAPEIGTLFAEALAGSLTPLANELGPDWTLLELGPGSGALAAALLPALPRPPARYLLLEPSAMLREVQHERLSQLPAELVGRIEWIDAPPEQPFDGVIVANEIIDALPVERFRVVAPITETVPRRLAVDWVNDRFTWTDIDPDPRLATAIDALQARLPAPLAPDYESELCVDLPDWMKTVTAPLARGLALFIDYGYPAAEYYHPERNAGTLVCHYRHRAHFDPFVWPGLTDLSAFVDFSAAARAGQDAGLDLAGFTTQAGFVLESGVGDRLAVLENDRERMQLATELKRLVLPGEMGEKFKLLALTRDIPQPPFFNGFDQSGRL
ncbi:MAG: class I SAM-dependent methyltransferase [Gammaproteobacteria bacterium]|nr:class I SAM-dependent methyltransferase [Gammaproteobacteria bacterium]